jgi:hypothetical protein
MGAGTHGARPCRPHTATGQADQASNEPDPEKLRVNEPLPVLPGPFTNPSITSGGASL